MQRKGPAAWMVCADAVLTQGGNQGQVLQHDVIVQESLSLAEEPPLLLGEVHRHVLKGHMALSGGGHMSSQQPL